MSETTTQATTATPVTTTTTGTAPAASAVPNLPPHQHSLGHTHSLPYTINQPTGQAVDINAIMQQAEEKATTKAAEKMEAVFKSMLQQSGLDTDTINKMTEEWKSKQQTPEQAMQDLQGKYQAEQAKNEALNQRMAALGKGIPADKADKYIALAKSYPDADKDIAKALDAALVDFPLLKAESQNPNKLMVPPMGSAPGAAITKEIFAKMGYKERAALHENDPTLYSALSAESE